MPAGDIGDGRKDGDVSAGENDVDSRFRSDANQPCRQMHTGDDRRQETHPIGKPDKPAICDWESAARTASQLPPVHG